jgi:hypothetical protein
VRSSLNAKLDGLVAQIATHLKPQGFLHHGKVLRSIDNGNAAIVEFQRSDRSSSQKIIFTVNLGVVCGDLLDPERAKIEKSTIEDAQLRMRLGGLLEPPLDAWWEIDAQTDDRALATELSQLIVRRAIPYLDQYKYTPALISLWETGKSPGLTAVQRSRYLSELKARHDSGSPT